MDPFNGTRWRSNELDAHTAARPVCRVGEIVSSCSMPASFSEITGRQTEVTESTGLD
jgi:hypothetical protein